MKRVETREKMERDDISTRELKGALRSIDRSHWLFFTFRRLFSEIKSLEPKGQCQLTVLDIGTGSGYLGNLLNKKFGDSIEYTGLDRSQDTLFDMNDHQNVVQGHALELPFGNNSFNVILTSLTLHHLPPEHLVPFLERTTEIGSDLVYHLDLLRGRVAHGLTWLASRLLSRNKIFHHDAPLSVKRSLSWNEWTSLLRYPELDDYTREFTFPFFINLICRL